MILFLLLSTLINDHNYLLSFSNGFQSFSQGLFQKNDNDMGCLFAFEHINDWIKCHVFV